MQYANDRHHLRVEITAKDCEIPADQRVRLQDYLRPLDEVVRDFPAADLWLTAIYHRQADSYHVEAKLRLPGKTLFGGEWDQYLDSAFERCLRKLLRKVEVYKVNPDREAVARAGRLAALDRDVVIPEGPDAGPLAEAVGRGDYGSFRTALARYEEWLRKRVGRWVQRYPEAQAKVGEELLLGDLIEEVYLSAFERFPHRAREVPLHDWLDGLIDPSLRALLRNPAAVRENASLARTLREMPSP